jgi:archaeal type IV pilus assembly protein PilA
MLAWWFDPRKLIHHCTTIFCTRGKNMHYQKRLTRKNGEDGVSPVIGVMLMLVVTIIIAAVVSGFAGGLIGGQQKSPTLSMDVKISNTGNYIGSGFSANVLGVSQPISSADTKIVTTWTTTMKNPASADLSDTQKTIAVGSVITGGNTSFPNTANIDLSPGMGQGHVTTAVAPFAIGTGITNTNPTNSFKDTYNASWFGHYTLQPGVNLFVYPYGSGSGMALGGAPGNADSSGGYNGVTPYTYMYGGSHFAPGVGTVDPTIAVLGSGWEQLRGGDTVHVKVIYIPTGAAIFSKDVAVTEG